MIGSVASHCLLNQKKTETYEIIWSNWSLDFLSAIFSRWSKCSYLLKVREVRWFLITVTGNRNTRIIGSIWSKIFKIYLGSMCTAVLIFWDPATLPPPQHLGSYTRAQLVSQERRHLFVTPRAYDAGIIIIHLRLITKHFSSNALS